jgi:hypothetical protein
MRAVIEVLALVAAVFILSLSGHLAAYGVTLMSVLFAVAGGMLIMLAIELATSRARAGGQLDMLTHFRKQIAAINSEREASERAYSEAQIKEEQP